jgi:kinesin family member 1
MNDTSSRSHAVFSVILTQRRHDVETGMDTEKVSRISLVDLAGSERANSTGAVGARLKEGAEINRSLSTLGRVIAALADVSTGKKKDIVVPFRDSILTWLLKDALGGNSRTAIIATISPADVNYEETLSTLRYADSAKRIKTHAVVNEDPNARLIRELKEELANLRAKLSGNPEVDGDFDPSLPPEKQFVMIRKPDGTLVRVSKAEIAEQLQASEKLMMEVNQTWEEKLLKTQAIQKERESALEALGISVDKGLIGFHSPRVPHLVNLSDDPLLAECLVYNLKPGATTTVGSVLSEANIKLSGSNILEEHCRFENTDNVVTLYPCEGALVMVNGLRLSEPKRLRSGFRVILGDFHFFRFNNPLEAKADRIRLRHSAQMSLSSPLISNSPVSGSDRGEISRTNSPTPLSRLRADSPLPFAQFSIDKDDSEWALARREAALAMIGPDSNVDMLNDDELDQLMSSLQKHKHLRKARPESRLTELDDDNESTVSSGQYNGKHDSIATFESLDYDTNLSSWPSPPEAHGQFNQLKVDLEQQLEQQKSEYEEKLASAKMANVEIEQLRQEKEEMQEMIAKAKQEAEQLLRAQAEEFEKRVKGIAKATGYLTDHEKNIAKAVVKRWRKYKGSKAVDTLLQYAGLLKESQILSLSLGKKVIYQFAIITHDPFPTSQYEQNLEIIEDSDDLLLYEKKPSIVVKVLDFNTNRVYFWSLSKFKDRLRLMRSQRDIVEAPFLDHESVKSNPFIDQQPPQYALIGITDVPLFAASQQRSHRMKLDIYSPHTFSIVAELDVSVISEPAITGEEQSFDIHLHTVQGFNSFLGSDFHVQADLSKAGLYTNERTVFVSKKRNLSTSSTLKYDQRFTVDSQLPIQKIGSGSTRSLRFEIYAKPKLVLLESLASWDELRSQDDAAKLDDTSTNHIVNGMPKN